MFRIVPIKICSVSHFKGLLKFISGEDQRKSTQINRCISSDYSLSWMCSDFCSILMSQYHLISLIIELFEKQFFKVRMQTIKAGVHDLPGGICGNFPSVVIQCHSGL